MFTLFKGLFIVCMNEFTMYGHVRYQTHTLQISFIILHTLSSSQILYIILYDTCMYTYNNTILLFLQYPWTQVDFNEGSQYVLVWCRKTRRNLYQ